MNDEKANSELAIQHSALKKPEIRFDGFREDWEAREFGNDLLSVQTGTDLLAASGNSGCPLIKMGNIQRGYFSFEKVERLSANVEVEKENLANYGDFLFNTRNTLELVGKGATWMGKSNEFAFNNNIARFTLKGINTIFFNYLYNTQRMIKQVQARAMGTTSVAAIYPNNLKSIRYTLPKIEEQTQIGKYFQKLDALINQHQQKHDKLSSIKKAMLEKMFPKQGETMPEIRFKGFSGEWEEKILGEMVTCFSGGTPVVGVEEYYKGNIPFIRSAEINKATTELTISESGLKNSSAKIVELGTVLYALYGATSGEVGRAKICGAINQAILAIVPRAKICPEFLAHWLRKNKGNIVNTYLQGGQGNLSGQIVKNLILKIPDFDEQTAIGNYFQKLDSLINQHQQQITKLNNIKQACLSKMFV
ncbi:restriction endonuclease subunit S [Hafnia paralvei]|uniref:restriction endonuclease subunit S n=1 Tax=Hafnia paralvei TaxID=546367 RepID=UPI003C2F0F00